VLLLEVTALVSMIPRDVYAKCVEAGGSRYNAGLREAVVRLQPQGAFDEIAWTTNEEDADSIVDALRAIPVVSISARRHLVREVPPVANALLTSGMRWLVCEAGSLRTIVWTMKREMAEEIAEALSALAS